MTELTKKELEYLINLCSKELDEDDITPSKIIDTIYKDFGDFGKYFNGRKLPPEVAADEFLNVIVDEMSKGELDKFIKKLTLLDAFQGTYKQKNITLNDHDYDNGLFSYSEFTDCKILIDLQTIPSRFFYNSEMTNCEITISNKCEVLEDHCICIYGKNNRIILPNSVEHIGKQKSPGHSPRSDSNVIIYKGTMKEFSKIDKAGRIDFAVQCKNGTVKYS